MSRYNVNQGSSLTDRTFEFEYETIRIKGLYLPYERLNHRFGADITSIMSTIPERQIYHRNNEHTRTGHLKPALSAFENLCYLEDLWVVTIGSIVNEFLPHALQRYGYKYQPKQGVYEKLLRGFTIAPQNDLKAYHERLLQKLESESDS